MRYLVILLALAVLIAPPALADNRELEDVTAGFAPQSIDASGLATKILDLQRATVHGAGYSFTTTGSINVTGLVYYSDRNLAADSTAWEAGSSIHSSTFTNSFTCSADKKRTDLRFLPARFVKIQLTNADAVPVTLNWFTFLKQ